MKSLAQAMGAFMRCVSRLTVPLLYTLVFHVSFLDSVFGMREGYLKYLQEELTPIIHEATRAVSQKPDESWVLMNGLGVEPCYISQETAQHILGMGVLHADQRQGGNHRTFFLGGIHWKQNSSNVVLQPLMEMAMGAFYRLLWEDAEKPCLAPATFLSLSGVHERALRVAGVLVTEFGATSTKLQEVFTTTRKRAQEGFEERRRNIQRAQENLASQVLRPAEEVQERTRMDTQLRALSQEEQTWKNAQVGREERILASAKQCVGLLGQAHLKGSSVLDAYLATHPEDVTPCLLSQSHVVQASQTIQGRTLLDYLREDPQGAELDLVSFNRLFIGGLVTNPTDYHDENFIVTPERLLVGIDNDGALDVEIVHHMSDGREGPKRCSRLETKNMLYLLKNREIPGILKSRLLKLSPTQLMQAWIRDLSHLEKAYEDARDTAFPFLTPGAFASFRLRFLPQALRRVYTNLCQIQEILQVSKEDTVSLSAHTLFQRLNPFVHHVYHVLGPLPPQEAYGRLKHMVLEKTLALEDSIETTWPHHTPKRIRDLLDRASRILDPIVDRRDLDQTLVLQDAVLEVFEGMGLHPATQASWERWDAARATLLPRWSPQTPDEVKPVIRLQGAFSGLRMIPEHIHAQLFDPTGIWQHPLDIPQGNHMVAVAMNGAHLLYFKYLPEFAGVEIAVGDLSRRLFGRGIPYSEVFCMDTSEMPEGHLSHAYHNHPVLVSQGIRGMDLKTAIKGRPAALGRPAIPGNPRITESLDPESIAEMILLGVAIHPEDWKPDNLVLEPFEREGNTLYRIIGVDNDRAFVSASAPEIRGSAAGTPPIRIQVKCALFCSDFMTSDIPGQVRATFLARSPRVLVERFLHEMSWVQARLGDLFPNQTANDVLWEQHKCYIGVPFERGAETHLYDRLVRMHQELGRQGTEGFYLPNFACLLERMEGGHLYDRYRHAWGIRENLCERFRNIDGADYGPGERTVTRPEHVRQHMEGRLQERTQWVANTYGPLAAIRAFSQNLERSAQEDARFLGRVLGKEEPLISSDLYRVFDFQSLMYERFPLSPDNQERVTRAVLNTPDLSYIDFRHTSIPNQSVLDCQSCTSLVNLCLEHVQRLGPGMLLAFEQCPRLRVVRLRDLPALTFFAKGFFRGTPLRLNALQDLTIEGCNTLEKILIETPNLQKLHARFCSQLKELDGIFEVQELVLRNICGIPHKAWFERVKNPIYHKHYNEMAQGHEADYARFLRGKLIYRPLPVGNEITLPIARLPNPLDGTFDLSDCGDAGKYLSISTGYRKGKRRANENKVEIWIAPRFLIEKELTSSAKHFQPIMGKWDPSAAPVGLFWTWGGWDDMGWYDYLTTESLERVSNGNLYEKWWASIRRRTGGQVGQLSTLLVLCSCECVHVSFVN